MLKAGDKKDNLGQMQLSFGMIFSIILIIAFIAFAFFAIKMFIESQNKAKTAAFVEDLQTDINKMWKAPQGSGPKEYVLSNNIGKVCFADDEYENLKFYPRESADLPPINLEHLDIYNMTRSKGSEKIDNVRVLCFDVINSRLEINLDKDFGEELVRVIK